MHRLNKVFFAVTISLALLGGVSVVDFGQTLGDIEDASLVAEQIETEVVSGEVVDGEFVVEAEIQNPTRFSLDLGGAYMSASSEGEQMAYGSIVNHEDIPGEIPARGSVKVTYVFALSDSQANELSTALNEGTVNISGQHSVTLNDTRFSVSFTGEVGE